MGKGNTDYEKEMFSKMTIQERMDYKANFLKMKNAISKSKKEAQDNYKDEPWIDEEDSEYDSFSNGGSDDDEWVDDDNEY